MFFAEGGVQICKGFFFLINPRNLATFTPSINNWCFSEQKNAQPIVLYSDSIGSNGNIYNAQPI